MIWSGLIKMVMMTYLKNFVAFYLAMKMIFAFVEVPDTGSIVTTVLTGLPLILFPIWSCVFLMKNKNELETETMSGKYDGLYSDLKKNYNIHST